MSSTPKSVIPHHLDSVYFGKIASRGDFVRSTGDGRLVGLFDSWVTQGMDLLIAAPNWKHRYDRRGPIDFLLLGTRKRHAICGALVPSSDASSRRFPFIAATLFDIDDALGFLPLGALLMERHLSRQRALIQLAAATPDATAPLAALEDRSKIQFTAEPEAYDHYARFLDKTRLKELSQWLGKSTEQATARQIILALGYLLQPMLTDQAMPPSKGIELPLPTDIAHCAVVKCLWLQMIAAFLLRTDIEVSVFCYQQRGQPKLVVTFNGASPATFCALFAEEEETRSLVSLAQAAWVEDCVRQDPRVLKLSTYLEHDELTLRQLTETFRQSFVD